MNGCINNNNIRRTPQQNISSSSNGVKLQPNISAESIFNTKTMTLGNNIKNLVILIPNEGHHAAGEDNEARFLDRYEEDPENNGKLQSFISSFKNTEPC
jgi:hypothetical protein